MAASLEPADAASAAALLAEAARSGRQFVPRGAGTKLHRVATSPDAVVLSSRQMVNGVEHFAGDLVATISAGTSLAAANAALARSGQWLPFDPPHAARATIGGIVATNDSGPRRHKYGAPRDLIIGIEMALADGRVARAGGRVVKNVAGYDLSRLACGSLGSLAFITSATFKLSPIPASSRTVLAHCADSQHACRLALALASAPITPSALEIEAPGGTLLVRFETTARAAEAMADAASTMLAREADDVDILSGAREQTLWQRHDDMIWQAPTCVLKMSVRPGDVADLLGNVEREAARRDLASFATGRAGLGILLLRLDGDIREVARATTAIRAQVVDRDGYVMPLEGTSELLAALPFAAASPLSRAVKAQFDPHGVLPHLRA